MTPKEFIQQVLINEIGEIHIKHPYISFGTMAVGIEFLGKCLNQYNDWDYYKPGLPKKDFERAINQLDAFTKYRQYLNRFKICDSLRNGFAHAFVPKKTISLSSKDEMKHLVIHNNMLNLRCEDFYNDFKSACEEIINMEKFPSKKMDSHILNVPNDKIDYSGTTMK